MIFALSVHFFRTLASLEHIGLLTLKCLALVPKVMYRIKKNNASRRSLLFLQRVTCLTIAEPGLRVWLRMYRHKYRYIYILTCVYTYRLIWRGNWPDPLKMFLLRIIGKQTWSVPALRPDFLSRPPVLSRGALLVQLQSQKLGSPTRNTRVYAKKECRSLYRNTFKKRKKIDAFIDLKVVQQLRFATSS